MVKKFTLFSLCLLIAACASKPYVVRLPIVEVPSGRNEIFVVNHGWHTGLVLPAEELRLTIPGLKERFNNALFIEFGWGDKGFYQANEITTGLTLRAMFWSSGSVIHAVAVNSEPTNFFQHSTVRKLCISDAGFSSLLHFVDSSFAKNSNGALIQLNKGIYGDSQFYAGVGEYYLFNTCNKWTAKGLASAGLNISPTFKLTAGSVVDFVQNQDGTCFSQPMPQ